MIEWQDEIYNAACRLLGDEGVAAKVARQVLEDAAGAPSRWRRQGFRLRLLQSLVGACRVEQKRRSGGPFRSRRRAHRTHGGLAPVFPEPAGSADQAPFQDRAAAFQASLNQLPFDLRVAVVLSDIVGLDYPEIARVTRIPVTTVGWRLGRGRTVLRDALLSSGVCWPDSPVLPDRSPMLSRPAGTVRHRANGCHSVPGHLPGVLERRA